MFPVKWCWCHFSIMKSISLSFQVITEAQIQEGHGLDTFQVQGWQHSCLLPGDRRAHWVKPMVPNELWPGVERPVHQLTSETQLLFSPSPRLPISWPARPTDWNPLLPRDTGVHCSTAGKINLGLTRCRHRSNTKILEDILHIPGTAPPWKIPPLYEDILWGLNEH